MKLAEALIERKSCKSRLEQIVKRMTQNVLVAPGDTPDEDIEQLVKIYEFMTEKLEILIIRINKTNNETKLGNMTIAEAIAKRDCIKGKIAAYKEVKEVAAKRKINTFSSEKYERTINVAEYQKKIDALSRQYRELDTKLQGHNWTVDLL